VISHGECLPTGIRLVGGPNDREGRLEVYHDEVWGTVCSADFTDLDAKTACMSLGFG
jgi:Scavenger receptor cysteine-rich domain